GDQAVLLGEHGVRRRVALQSAEHVARDPPGGALRALLIRDTEQYEFRPRSRFASHCPGPFLGDFLAMVEDRRSAKQRRGIGSLTDASKTKPGAPAPGLVALAREHAG